MKAKGETMLMQTDCPAIARMQTLAEIMHALGWEYGRDGFGTDDSDMNEYLRSIQSHFNVTHESGDGRGLHFSFDSYKGKGRMRVSVKWPTSKERHEYRGAVESITLDYSRDPVKLANEIKRRVLAEYHPQAAKRDAADDRRAKQLALASKLAKLLGTSNTRNEQPEAGFYTHSNSVIYKVEVRDDGGVKFESAYNVPQEVATDILAFAMERMTRYRVEHRNVPEDEAA
jgi:hypothetical protein